MKDELGGLHDEIRDHLDRETQDNINRGMSPADARHAALRKFGNVARVQEETRDVWRRVWLDQLVQDARYGLRVLLHNPRFALVVLATLALAIGMNTAVFSVVNAVLLRPLDYPHPERLVWLADYDPNIRRDYADLASFESWRKLTTSYTGMAEYGYHQTAISAGRSSGEATAIYIDGDFWTLTGAHAAIGQLCGAGDTGCLVVSWDFFQHRLDGDSRAIGGTAMAGGRPCRIAGVLGRAFRLQLPMWWVADHPQPVEAYIPRPPRGETMAQSGQVFAALKPGAGIEQAQTELRALNAQLVASGVVRRPFTGLRVEPLQQKLAADSRRALMVLMAAAGFVLLIACVNIASLLMARAAARRKEVAIRTAIGAGRWRVLRQFAVESLLLALGGGLAGLLLARWAIAILIRISPFAIPRLTEAVIDARVAAFACAVSLLAAILFSAGSFVSCLRADLHASLKDGARTAASLLPRPTRRLLMTAELALAIVLLTAAGLMWKSYARMIQYPPGFTPAQTVVMKVRFSGPKYRDDAGNAAYVRSVLDAVESVPGLRPAGLSTWVLMGNLPPFPADIDPTTRHVIRMRAVSAGYLQALGVKLLRGTWLPQSGPAILLNETLARQAFGSADPIGRQISLRKPRTIVGIVADLKYSKLDVEPPPEAFVSLEQMPPSFYVEIAGRAWGDPETLASMLQRRITAIDPAQPVYEVKTLEQALTDSIAPRRLNLFLLATFAGVALALALVGVYGVMAYSVAERTREIGVRIALGARRGQVIAMVVTEAGAVALAGIAVGLAAAWSSTRAMASLLYGVAPDDPMVFGTVAIALGLTATAACLGPALKASWIDPAVALRSE
jgi:predicted permease